MKRVKIVSDIKRLNVGKIVNTHGLKGEVKVIRITNFDDRFKKGTVLYFTGKMNNQSIPLTIKHHRTHKQFDLLQFESYDTIEDVEPFKEGMLTIEIDQHQPLEEGTYYYYQIIGCQVYTTNGEKLGIVKEIMAPGANDVWVVKCQDGKEVLIPYIEDVVKTVDVNENKIIIEPMEGLLT